MKDYIPLAALNHYAYCPHRCWRMFCLGDFIDNAYTLEGTGIHERVHTVGTGIREDVQQVRAVWLKSEHYQLIGKSDLIEEQNGLWIPIEYKRGRKGEWDNDTLQLCGQALCLEEMTEQTIPYGYIYYAQTHQRQQIEISESLRQQTLDAIQSITALFEGGFYPDPIYSPRCHGCSLYDRCLPEAVSKVKRYQES